MDKSWTALQKFYERSILNGFTPNMFNLPKKLPCLVLDYRLIRSVAVTDDDYYVTTYPKCGTTWTQQVVHQLRTGGDEDYVLGQACPWIMDHEVDI